MFLYLRRIQNFFQGGDTTSVTYPVPALGQLRPPPENFTWGPLYPQSKWKEKWFYTECDFHPILHFMHIHAIFDERT